MAAGAEQISISREAWRAFVIYLLGSRWEPVNFPPLIYFCRPLQTQHISSKDIHHLSTVLKTVLFFLHLCTHMVDHTVYNFVWISAPECLNKWLEWLMSLADDHQPLWMQNGIQRPEGHPSWISPEITMPTPMQRLKFKKKKGGKLQRTRWRPPDGSRYMQEIHH